MRGIERVYAGILNQEYTLESAQPLTFHSDYYRDESTLVYVTGRSIVEARFFGDTEDKRIEARCNGRRIDLKDEIRRRFRLGDDIDELYRRINTDKMISGAIERYRGMRVTLNEPWETTLCFIVSQFNNVKRIRGIVRKIIDNFGEEIYGPDGKVFHTFPQADVIRELKVDDIMRCGAGFRARYIRSAAEYCTDNIDLNRLNGRSYEDIKSELMQIEGVGDKVADCIALMGFGRFEAFPIDVWIKRTVERMYFNGKARRVREIHDFARERWGDTAGFAQQYIFWYGRNVMDRYNRSASQSSM